MNKNIYYALFCVSLVSTGLAMDAASPADVIQQAKAFTEWDLNNPCNYTCKRVEGDLTYTELLAAAQKYGGSLVDWAIVNRAIRFFSRPVKVPAGLNDDVFNSELHKALGLDFTDADFRAFRQARENLIEWFIKEKSNGLSDFKGTDINSYSRGRDSQFAHDFSFALDILHKNSWDYVGSLQ